MLATLPVLALIERRSLGCDLTTRGSTQVVAWRVLGVVIDQRLLDPWFLYRAIRQYVCRPSLCHSDWAIQSYQRTLRDFCDETQHVSFRAVG